MYLLKMYSYFTPKVFSFFVGN